LARSTARARATRFATPASASLACHRPRRCTSETRSSLGALLNTVRLEDKTWFLGLLMLRLISVGWLAMVAYLLAGPGATSSDAPRRGLATTPGT
jgi:hypothetical protein